MLAAFWLTSITLRADWISGYRELKCNEIGNKILELTMSVTVKGSIRLVSIIFSQMYSESWALFFCPMATVPNSCPGKTSFFGNYQTTKTHHVSSKHTTHTSSSEPPFDTSSQQVSHTRSKVLYPSDGKRARCWVQPLQKTCPHALK